MYRCGGDRPGGVGQGGNGDLAFACAQFAFVLSVSAPEQNARLTISEHFAVFNNFEEIHF